ncbi:hypothetical protein mvi_62610 (plasmid) [Methylobacterium indicum]|uniref:Uncharacterized protein n=1 Tax=Methylobacterium indicum TaxID=1775910 RepID=A0A8H9CAU2_9HYPH|nr:hypothetical protein mvi_62610 [Methylobacterium indicum]
MHSEEDEDSALFLGEAGRDVVGQIAPACQTPRAAVVTDLRADAPGVDRPPALLRDMDADDRLETGPRFDRDVAGLDG